MTDRSSSASPPDDERGSSRTSGDKSGEMREADVANGENPDEQVERSAGTTPDEARTDEPRGDDAHRTGDQQAQENRENELPA